MHNLSLGKTRMCTNTKKAVRAKRSAPGKRNFQNTAGVARAGTEFKFSPLSWHSVEGRARK